MEVTKKYGNIIIGQGGITLARKFFNQRVKGSGNSKIGYIIVGIVVFLIFFAVIVMVMLSNRESGPAPVIEIRGLVTVEINSEAPDKTLFFSELQNVSEDEINVSFDEVDLAIVGEYPVEIEVDGETYEATLAVVDTEAPTLVVKNHNINLGEQYVASDFVESCVDNSGEECNISFYSMGMDQDGNTMFYDSYTEEGTYTVQIVASDNNGNSTTATSATLTIGESSGIAPTYCNYGNDEYDTEAYILGVNVTQDGCALDLNLYYNENVNSPAYELANQDEERLTKEISKINISNSKENTINQIITPVLNTAGTGIVGYTVHIELSILYTDDTREVVAIYYIQTDGSRVY